jgi:hypothetical protein
VAERIVFQNSIASYSVICVQSRHPNRILIIVLSRHRAHARYEPVPLSGYSVSKNDRAADSDGPPCPAGRQRLRAPERDQSGPARLLAVPVCPGPTEPISRRGFHRQTAGGFRWRPTQRPRQAVKFRLGVPGRRSAHARARVHKGAGRPGPGLPVPSPGRLWQLELERDT